MSSNLIIAIDGPAGSGKSTVAQQVARRLGYRYIESGATYRAVAWAVEREGISPQDRQAVVKLCRRLKIAIEDSRVLVDGQEITSEVHSSELGELASRISVYPEVREEMVRLQRSLGQHGRVVMEGRDIQTVVFPEAQVKIFLIASEQERARRRQKDLGRVPLAVVQREISERDSRDRQRRAAPLRPALDAVTVDTTDLTVEQVVEKVLELVSERQV